MPIGNKLLALRKQRGISQEALSADLHISQSTISNYELGITHPDIKTLKKLATYFQIPVHELLSDDNFTIFNHKNRVDTVGNIVHQTFSKKLIDQYEKRLVDKEEMIIALKQTIQEQKEYIEVLKMRDFF